MILSGEFSDDHNERSKTGKKIETETVEASRLEVWTNQKEANTNLNRINIFSILQQTMLSALLNIFQIDVFTEVQKMSSSSLSCSF